MLHSFGTVRRGRRTLHPLRRRRRHLSRRARQDDVHSIFGRGGLLLPNETMLLSFRTPHPPQAQRLRSPFPRGKANDVRSIFGRGGACSSRTKRCCIFLKTRLLRNLPHPSTFGCHLPLRGRQEGVAKLLTYSLLPITSYLKKHLISQVLFSHLLSSISRRYRSDSIQYS